MRGFRQNRANLNQLTSHFGRKEQTLFKGGEHSGHGQGSHEEQHKQRPALPDWLKAPETREKERIEALHPKASKLRLVPDLPPPAQVTKAPAAVKPAAAKPATLHAVKPAPTTAQSKPKRKSAAPKRKAAAVAKRTPKKAAARTGRAKPRKAA